jgi:cell division protein FtsZ
LELAFRLADDVLRQAVQGISELITEPGYINVDFAHIRRLIRMGGGAMMSMGQGQGEDKTKNALDKALHHPLLETVSLENAAGIIANFTGGDDLTLFEVQEALTYLQEQTSSQAEIVMGVINDERMQGRVQVTLVVTGIGAPTLEEAMSGVVPTEEPEPVLEKPRNIPIVTKSQPETPPTWVRPSDQDLTTPTSTNLDLPAFLRRRLRYSG